MKKLRILHCAREGFPIVSGNTVRVRNISKAQTKNNDVIVAVGDYKRNNKQVTRGYCYRVDNVDYYVCNKKYLNDVGFNKKFFSFPRSWFNILQYKNFITELAIKHEVDIIHGHSSYSNALPALLSAKKLGIPFIYDMNGITELSRLANGVFSEKSIKYKWLSFWEQFVIKKADGISCINKGVVDYIINKKLKSKTKMIVINNGVDTDFFFHKIVNTSCLKIGNLLDNVFKIGMVSPRYHEGIYFLLNSIAEYFENFPEDRLIIFGNGKDMNEDSKVINIIKKNKFKNNIYLTGRIPFDKINEYYNIPDLFIIPRIKTKENNMVSPLKTLELMAVGKPLLISDVLGLTNQIENNSTGIVFRAEDRNDFIKKLLYCRNNYNNLLEMGLRARNYVSSYYSWDSVVNNYFILYKDLIKNTFHRES